jgi:nucleoside-diphosphate-sugar epimerase
MKVALTGSRGFIASHLGNRLVDLGYDVLGIDNLTNPSTNETRFHTEVMNYQDYTGTPDAIFHLAASINVDESIAAPGQYFENNALGTLRLLERLRDQDFKGKFIYASSAEVYGSARTPKMSEEHLTDPLSPYAVSKLAAEQMCKNFAQLYGMDITVIRNFNTFGEHQRGGVYGGVIAKFASLAKEGKDLPVYGSGEQMRDYMYIKQAVNGYVLALEGNLPTIVNFGSGVPIKIIDIANYIAKKFGVRVVHEKVRPNEIMRLEADITRAVQHGYKVETDFWTNLENYLNA